jgi:exodeoxyribonuclease VII small subunit
MTKTPDYTHAFKELIEIVNDIEKGDITVDALSDKVKRAAELIAICKQKLRATELDVRNILQELDEIETGGESRVN